MPYTENWRKLLREISKKQRLNNSFSETCNASDFFSEVDLERADFTGQMIAYTGNVLSTSDNDLFKSLRNAYELNNDLKNAFPGELKVSKSAGGEVVIDYHLITPSSLIERYRQEQMPKNLKDEVYKFQLIKQFQDKWKFYAADSLSFASLMEGYPFGNLVNTQFVPNIFKHVLQEVPKQWELLLLALYNEEEPLSERISAYQKKFQNLYFSLPDHGKNHGQEERTIATLLAFRYPDKYALFKDGFYTPFCKGMGIKPKPAGQKLLHYYAEIVPKIQEVLSQQPDVIEWKNRYLKASSGYPDPQNVILAQDIMYTTVNNVKPLLINKNYDRFFKEKEIGYHPQSTKNMHALNTILYGPPGTGKTYNSINHALSIVEGEPLESYEQENREEVKKRFDALLMKGEQGEGQIGFITFHQSLSYEDFVEGIKPVAPEDADAFLKYEVQPGILKRIAELARYKPDAQTERFSIPESDFGKAMFYKMSLGRANNEEDEAIYRWCMDNGYIALGWGDDIDFSNKSEVEIRPLTKENGLDDFHGDAIKRFVHWIHEGDYVLISEGNRICRAIGRVTSSYEFKGESPIPYHQFRKVEWLLKDVSIPVEEIYGRAFSMMSIYQLDK